MKGPWGVGHNLPRPAAPCPALPGIPPRFWTSFCSGSAGGPAPGPGPGAARQRPREKRLLVHCVVLVELGVSVSVPEDLDRAADELGDVAAGSVDAGLPQACCVGAVLPRAEARDLVEHDLRLVDGHAAWQEAVRRGDAGRRPDVALDAAWGLVARDDEQVLEADTLSLEDGCFQAYFLIVLVV